MKKQHLMQRDSGPSYWIHYLAFSKINNLLFMFLLLPSILSDSFSNNWFKNMTWKFCMILNLFRFWRFLKRRLPDKIFHWTLLIFQEIVLWLLFKTEPWLRFYLYFCGSYTFLKILVHISRTIHKRLKVVFIHKD